MILYEKYDVDNFKCSANYLLGEFFMCLHFCVECGTTHNQPQQAGISMNEVVLSKARLKKPKQLWVILENYF